MSTKLESDLEHQFKFFCHSLGIRCEKLKLASEAGWPDRTLLYQGRVMFVELKRKGERPTPLQEYVLMKLQHAGFEACWTDDLQDAKGIIISWRNRK